MLCTVSPFYMSILSCYALVILTYLHRIFRPTANLVLMLGFPPKISLHPCLTRQKTPAIWLHATMHMIGRLHYLEMQLTTNNKLLPGCTMTFNSWTNTPSTPAEAVACLYTFGGHYLHGLRANSPGSGLLVIYTLKKPAASLPPTTANQTTHGLTHTPEPMAAHTTEPMAAPPEKTCTVAWLSWTAVLTLMLKAPIAWTAVLTLMLKAPIACS